MAPPVQGGLTRWACLNAEAARPFGYAWAIGWDLWASVDG